MVGVWGQRLVGRDPGILVQILEPSKGFPGEENLRELMKLD